ncbi:HAD family hydrolase [Chromatocurvus halotolerans]|uniref:Putative hydrolase of the HAD superfamily n=1 Tax=Chromatocurvus halotolerans TaxID=1132028 RepID=A0A4R2L3R9_9GAMM|nr:HAD family hydrolase [Chromatocurvus halotolerans]TCO77218.1 putative hydrolase of the HAD superfamily [Chromatocurvus halotolerans]
MSIRVVTFDLDNTLWDVTPALLRAEETQRAWMLEHRPGSMEGIDHDALLAVRKAVAQRHPELLHHVSRMRQTVLYELQRQAGYDHATAQAGAEAAFAVFLQERHAVELYEEALAVIQQLHRSYRLGALTNGNADIYKTDAGDYFDFAFLAEDIGASKPAPDMFQAAIARSGVEPHNIAHVGDSLGHDVRGARDAGLRTVWFNPNRESATADVRPDVEISCLGDLPQALRALQHRSELPAG